MYAFWKKQVQILVSQIFATLKQPPLYFKTYFNIISLTRFCITLLVTWTFNVVLLWEFESKTRIVNKLMKRGSSKHIFISYFDTSFLHYILLLCYLVALIYCYIHLYNNFTNHYQNNLIKVRFVNILMWTQNLDKVGVSMLLSKHGRLPATSSNTTWRVTKVNKYSKYPSQQYVTYEKLEENKN